ncbi:Mrp/NBP35 family ATP-binding protein [Natronorarus salvus]|uniref:Mrp/NBP35 family ATP-binding protein n=1 Tax=Natronorarus salvus TaxID=3117733 RepID=UPI002F26099B
MTDPLYDTMTTDTNVGATERSIEERLESIEDPHLGEDVVSLGLVNHVRVADGTAEVSLAFNAPYAPVEMDLGDRIREAILEMGLEPDLTARVGAEQGFDEEVLPNVRNVIAVSSGKGGVGKTTVAGNLAAGLHDRGARVGILDADVHGPNVPRVLPVEGDPGVTPNGELVPPRSEGVMVMSMRFLTERPDDPAILRGPMVNNVMMKFLEGVEWGRLDYLIVDLPPGTGDASLDLLQTMPVTGALILSTPQRMSLDDARKGIRMFEGHHVPILGVVENMATFRCPGCDDDHEVFGGEGTKTLREDHDVPLVSRLPLHPDFGADGTERPVVREPESPVHDVTDELVGTVADRISEVNRKTVAANRGSSDSNGENAGETAKAAGTR